jgi:hypothetical protein
VLDCDQHMWDSASAISTHSNGLLLMAAIFQLATDTSVEPNLLYRAAVIDVVVLEVYDITSHMTHTSPNAPAIPFIKRCLRGTPKKERKNANGIT